MAKGGRTRKTVDPLAVSCPVCKQPPELPCWKVGRWGARINIRAHFKRYALAEITPTGYIEEGRNIGSQDTVY